MNVAEVHAESEEGCPPMPTLIIRFPSSPLGVRSARSVAAAVMLTLAFASVKADAPPVGVWVELNVSRCEPVVFHAPTTDSGMYVPGDLYGTTRIVGTVVDSGLRPYDASEKWRREAADAMRRSLPKVGSELQFVLPEWRKSFCETAVKRSIRFDHDDGCDTWPRRGPCLPPHQRVTPSRSPTR